MTRIITRSNELQTSVGGMLERGQRRHLERNALLSSLYQNLSYLRHLQKVTHAQDDILLNEMNRLIVAAIATPRAAGDYSSTGRGNVCVADPQRYAVG